MLKRKRGGKQAVYRRLYRMLRSARAIRCGFVMRCVLACGVRYDVRDYVE